MLVQVREDQALSMKCYMSGSPFFKKAGEVFLTKSIAKDQQPPSVMKTSRNQYCQTFPSKKGVEQIEHPPYLPDLNPTDFFLFPRLKLALKGKRFDDIPDIQRSTQSEQWHVRSKPLFRINPRLCQRC
ncbi:hypothetical protein TNCV_4524991 [Trichonephila clavipes]|nr:hypothetical protein TNCV_4524991 [Trichonephila clavipes]